MYYNPYYGYYGDFGPNSYDSNVLAAVVGILVLVGIFAFALAVVLYIFEAFALYQIGSNRGMKNAFLAFIPVANIYFLGKIADDIGLTMNKKTNHAKRLLISCVLLIVLPIFGGMVSGIISVIFTGTGLRALIALPVAVVMLASAACSIVTVIFEYIALYQIYKEYTPANAVLFLVLSILFSVVEPFLLFAIRNKKSGYQLWCEQQAASRAYSAQTSQSADEPIETTVSEPDRTDNQ